MKLDPKHITFVLWYYRASALQCKQIGPYYKHSTYPVSLYFTYKVDFAAKDIADTVRYLLKGSQSHV